LRKKKVVLELGGNAAVVVDADTKNLDDAVNRIIFGAFYQSVSPVLVCSGS